MTPHQDFVNLHVHSDYSILDGGGKIKAYCRRVAELGQPALAVTDHGTMGGAYALWREARDHGIKPIIGIEAYVAPRSRFTKESVYFGSEAQRSDDVSGQGRFLHLTLLGRNEAGVKNLYRLQHRAFSEGFYGKPRIDFDLLSEYSEGIIAFSGCPSGHIQTYLRLDQRERADLIASTLKDIFGDRFFIEVMDHGIEIERRVLSDLEALSYRLNIPMVATADTHYCLEEDAPAHDTLLCIQTKAFKSDTNRFMFDGTGYHIGSLDEMLYGTSLPQSAIENTLVVADMVEEEYGSLFEPRLRLPYVDGNPSELLRESVLEGLRGNEFGPEHFVVAEYELSVIESAGFSGYFVALQRAMDRGRAAGIRFGPGRGSAAGSVVSRALGITQLDPIEHGLLFERFLNPDRLSAPDIDIDIDDARRPEFLRLVVEEFGAEHVAQVNTYGTIGAKAALKDSARALGYPYAVGNELTQQLPPARFGRAPSLDEFPKSYKSYPEIVRTARSIEGLIRNTGTHASAVIVSPEKLTDLIPTRVTESGKGVLVSELDGDELADLGFVKWDFLGLTALSVIEKCLKLIGEPVNLDDVFGDTDVFRLLSRGDTTGIFQLEGLGMRKLLNRVRPTSLLDVSAVLALYRPGPMGANAHTEYASRKNGFSSIEYPHREYEHDLSDVLSETFGVIVFQEQVLKVLAKVGGYTYGTAENIFNAMRKKDTQKMLAAKPDFIQRLSDRGYSQEATEALWNVLVPFSDYSFNKSHSTGYAIVALWEAYLKVHYPWHYWAALLTCEDKPEKLAEYVGTAIDEGVPILPPDINESGPSWTPTKDGIRYGLTAIKGVSHATCTMVRGSGPYRTMAEFWERVPKTVLKKNTLEALVKAGCFDSLESERETLLYEAEALAARALEYREQKGQLYSSYAPTVRRPFNLKARQTAEKEVLGVAITQNVVTLQLSYHLTPEEWLYVWKTLQLYPGLTPVNIVVGPLTRLHGYAKIRTDPKLFSSLATVGITGGVA